MRKLIITIVILTLSLSIVGCSNNPEEEAKKVAMEYMNTIYKVEDFTELKTNDIMFDKSMEKLKELKPLITDQMINYLLADRIVIMFYKAANILEKNISLGDIELVLSDSEDDVIYFNYTMKVNYTSLDNKEELEELSGQIKLVKVNDEWKVDREKPASYGKLLM